MATKNFTDAELECHCGCGALPSIGLQRDLQGLRDDYDKPMRLSSCKRCPDHNDAESSTGRDGPHTVGAVDVLIYGVEAVRLLECAMNSLCWTGIGISQKGTHATRFIHLDMLPNSDKHPRPWIWSY